MSVSFFFLFFFIDSLNNESWIWFGYFKEKGTNLDRRKGWENCKIMVEIGVRRIERGYECEREKERKR